MSVRRIHMLLTGGTIEKVYDEVRGGIDNLEGRIDFYFPRLRLPYVRIIPRRVMNIDSLGMTDEHRAEIVAYLRSILPDGLPVVITHGTDTMVETGKYIRARLPEVTVPIVLTGAMLPLVVENSDGLQNLAESIFATRFLAPDVYIVFHNECYTMDNVRKNREKKTFEKPSECGGA